LAHLFLNNEITDNINCGDLKRSRRGKLFVRDCNRNRARSFEQRTFHLCIFTMKGRETVVRIYRSYSQQEQIWAKFQNLTERPTIHRGGGIPPAKAATQEPRLLHQFQR
jgi:hypothetical protein